MTSAYRRWSMHSSTRPTLVLKTAKLVEHGHRAGEILQKLWELTLQSNIAYWRNAEAKARSILHITSCFGAFSRDFWDEVFSLQNLYETLIFDYCGFK